MAVYPQCLGYPQVIHCGECDQLGRLGKVPAMRRHATAAATRPLLITADPDLLDEMLRLASSAGVELEVAQDVIAARRGYTSASIVLLGADAVSLGMRARLPRRHS